MNNSFTLSNNRKKEVIEATSDRTGIFLQISKKDLWVTTVLQIVFSLPFADKIVFKGGTSLSKVWNLIERFPLPFRAFISIEDEYKHSLNLRRRFTKQH